jgi:aldehyde dehydrogenase (NAD+)/betaine-aldehyde dehydrogenase
MTEVTKPNSLSLVTAMTIDGKAVAGKGATLTVPNPATGQTLGELSMADLSQAEEAIRAARKAFDSGIWSGLSPAERSAGLHRLADALERRRSEMVATIVSEVGSPVPLAEMLQVDVPLRILRWNANAAAKDRTLQLGPDFEVLPSSSYVGYRPVGVVTAIAAYNYPLHLAMLKIGAALAAGCTVVASPSMRTPFATLLLGEIAREADLPDGVLNIIVGDLEVNKLLTTHEYVDKVSFTGSAQVGSIIMAQAAQSLKGVTLELGGKSPSIVMPDTDFTDLVYPMHARYTRNAGQGCASPTRILMHESRMDEFIDRSKAAWSQLKVGDPWDRETVAGPLIRPEHLASVAGFVQSAKDDGGSIIAGGHTLDLGGGWYHEPTLVTGVANSSHIAQEEIFGPVAVLLSYKTVDEAIQIANDSKYGLAAYVFGPDTSECLKVADRLRAGIVQVNGGGSLRPDAPYGGFKHSGIGREIGEDGIMDYLEASHVQFALTPSARK